MAYLLSFTRLHSWSHTVLIVQAYWVCAYLIHFVVLETAGSFWSIPFLALMLFFFPGIMILVSLGAWLGYRLAQFRHVRSQTNWLGYLLARDL